MDTGLKETRTTGFAYIVINLETYVCTGVRPNKSENDPGPISSAFAAEGAPGCMGVVRQKPSFAGEGAASPHPGDPGRSPVQVMPGSGQEPTRVGSCRYSACTAGGASGGKSVDGPKPSDAGEGSAAPLSW